MFKLDQKGQTLPIVIGVTALILANTYYFMEIDKSATARNILAGSQVSEQTEQSRISSYLADFNVCSNSKTGVGNFYGRNITTLQNTAGLGFNLVKGATEFLAVNAKYVNETHKVTKFHLEADPLIASDELKYSLMVYYTVINSRDDKPVVGTVYKRSNIKKTALIKVPLYIKTDASGNIQDCYARPPQDTVANSTTLEIVVTESCINPAAGPTVITAFVETGASIKRCFTNVTGIDCGGGLGLNNATVSGAVNTQGFTCNGMSSTCTTSPNQTGATAIVNSVPTCVEPRNGGCPAGSAMVKINDTTTACSTNCGANQLLNSINGATGAAFCYDRYYPCPSGQYAKTIAANGAVTCDYVKFRNVDCGNNYYATDLDPNDASTPLNCSYYSRVKSCAGVNNFVQSFTAVTPYCRNFYY